MTTLEQRYAEAERKLARERAAQAPKRDDGSVPVYRDEDERDADVDGDACDMLIRVDSSEHT